MGWQLEIGKMFMYVSFPVAIFYYFNQPQNFEKWVIDVKKLRFPAESRQLHKQMNNFIYEFNAATEKHRLDEMENQQNMK